MVDENMEGNDSATRLNLYLYYAQQTEALIERRNGNNRYFLTINTGLVAIISLALKFQPEGGTAWLVILALAGGIACVIWAALIRSYRMLTKARFAVILDLEKQLPSAPYTDEWQRIKENPVYKGYTSIARLEAAVPWIFVAIYAGLLLGALILN